MSRLNLVLSSVTISTVVKDQTDGTYGHAQQTRGVMLEGKVFIGEGFRAVNGSTACAITIEEVTALNHEVLDLQEVNTYFTFILRSGEKASTYHSMELAALVALWSTLSVLHLSGTELSEVFGSLGGSIGEEFHLNATKGLSLKRVVRRSSFSNVLQWCDM